MGEMFTSRKPTLNETLPIHSNTLILDIFDVNEEEEGKVLHRLKKFLDQTRDPVISHASVSFFKAGEFPTRVKFFFDDVDAEGETVMDLEWLGGHTIDDPKHCRGRGKNDHIEFIRLYADGVKIDPTYKNWTDARSAVGLGTSASKISVETDPAEALETLYYHYPEKYANPKERKQVIANAQYTKARKENLKRSREEAAIKESNARKACKATNPMHEHSTPSE
jgi:hypothetical protein